MALNDALQRLAARPFHKGAALSLGRADGSEQHFGAGDLDPATPFFAASATKLLVGALLLMLEQEGRLALSDPFRRFLTGPETAGLARIGDRDHTDAITLRQLMAHTSGLPDYFQSDAAKDGLFAALTRGQDRAWSFAEAMEITRRLGPLCPPGATRRARYSDSNYQILGQVIETIEARPLAEVMARRLFAPLGLKQSWLYGDARDARPRLPRYREAALYIPRAMASFQADGGLVTTTREALALTRAIFADRFFPAAALAQLFDWRPMFFPLSYGTGLMRFALPRLMTGFRRMPPMIGHSGLTGTAFFHAPDTGLTIAATVNQIARPGTVFRLMMRAAQAG